MKSVFVTLSLIYSISSSLTKSKLTLDEFFNYTDVLVLKLSPVDAQSLLIQTKSRVWDENINQYHLHLHSMDNGNKTLISRNASSSLPPLWYGEWIAFTTDNPDIHHQYYINLYSTRTQETFPINIGKEPLHALTWSNDGATLYFAVRTTLTDEEQEIYEKQWKNVIEHRDNERGDTLYSLNIYDICEPQIEIITNISLRVSELICSSDGKYLILSTESKSQEFETIEEYEIYTIDLSKQSSIAIKRITNNQAVERNLKWFNDSIFFTVTGAGSIEASYKDTQGRLYAINIHTGHIQRWAEQFPGTIKDFDFFDRGQGGVIILGQWKTEVHVYIQKTVQSQLIEKNGWPGTYRMLVTSSGVNKSTIAFVHSSFDSPEEIYITDTIDRLSIAQPLTNMNQLFTERSLPKGTTYQWRNEEDLTEIEGILLYPPDRYEEKNLPLLVLIHGGPYNDADMNVFHADWYYSAIMMASDDWLVFQPNYRGSGGYGDQFLHDLLLGMVSRPGKDILYGVDALVRDGIADSTKLTIGGYSYGGYLTNWIITQTTRFNAALSGAAAVETVSDWGTNDEPLPNAYYLGGFPWEVPSQYWQEAAIFQIDKVRTPTLIVTGDTDRRVPTAQSFILERALHFLNVPAKLLVFPEEGHLIENNPWHEKIKVREELKWLRQYGNVHVLSKHDDLISDTTYQRNHSLKETP